MRCKWDASTVKEEKEDTSFCSHRAVCLGKELLNVQTCDRLFAVVPYCECIFSRIFFASTVFSMKMLMSFSSMRRWSVFMSFPSTFM